MFFAGFTQESKTGSLALLRGKRSISQTTAAAFSHDKLSSNPRKVRKELTAGRFHNGAIRDRKNRIRAVPSLTEVTHALSTVFRSLVRVSVVGQQSRDLGIDFKDDRATIATVTTIRAAQGLKFLALDRGNAVAAVASLGENRYSIDKACHCGVPRLGQCAPARIRIVKRGIRPCAGRPQSAVGLRQRPAQRC